ncbi:SagB/ThcOx family dehydrogenase [Sulfurospirillum sp. 1612]|uniref:SagB/ThcOx family dehydrogenase n=1 Tax=Sulfurospirillum sp. 1612 TaxID=3094835 RepID=UPI002F922860
MNQKVEDIFEYHEQTKHSYSRYARSLGYMDWANQPDPYRFYQGAPTRKLPIMIEAKTPAYHDLFTDTLLARELNIDTLSQFLQFSLALAAIKTDGFNEWALRCNASSGNLHPSEGYLILPPCHDISTQTTLTHYAPKNHSLEILGTFESDIWNHLPKDSFFIAISSILYREIWKYGERAFRYCLLDAGHALRALQISAQTLGWHHQLIGAISDTQISKIFGFDQPQRFNENEKEAPEMLLLISSQKPENLPEIAPLLQNLFPNVETIANHIAQNYQSWPLIDIIEKATHASIQKTKTQKISNLLRECKKEAKEVILERRSAQVMDQHKSNITYKEFMIMLESTRECFSGLDNAINLIIFAHRITGLKEGLYIYIREATFKEKLQQSMHPSFSWEKRDENLYLLKRGDFKTSARNISCAQAIASDSAFSLGMLCHFHDEISQKGTHRYKELYWECGAIGQQLYLEATSLGLSATGIGCFLDDIFHTLLGLKSDTFQSLYHFTIGRGIKDERLMSKKPYN